MSFPLRERGLKQNGGEYLLKAIKSFPLRERGLKHLQVIMQDLVCQVVPLAGTWIETQSYLPNRETWF